jgi:hypothetical protein
VARQNRGEPHDTSLNALWPSGGGAIGSTDQVLPVHRSARSCVGPPGELAWIPTAVHSDHEVHDTDWSAPVSGERTMLQLAATALEMSPPNSATIVHKPATHNRPTAPACVRNTRTIDELSHRPSRTATRARREAHPGRLATRVRGLTGTCGLAASWSDGGGRHTRFWCWYWSFRRARSVRPAHRTKAMTCRASRYGMADGEAASIDPTLLLSRQPGN